MSRVQTRSTLGTWPQFRGLQRAQSELETRSVDATPARFRVLECRCKEYSPGSGRGLGEEAQAGTGLGVGRSPPSFQGQSTRAAQERPARAWSKVQAGRPGRPSILGVCAPAPADPRHPGSALPSARGALPCRSRLCGRAGVRQKGRGQREPDAPSPGSSRRLLGRHAAHKLASSICSPSGQTRGVQATLAPPVAMAGAACVSPAAVALSPQRKGTFPLSPKD